MSNSQAVGPAATFSKHDLIIPVITAELMRGCPTSAWFGKRSFSFRTICSQNNMRGALSKWLQEKELLFNWRFAVAVSFHWSQVALSVREKTRIILESEGMRGFTFTGNLHLAYLLQPTQAADDGSRAE